MIPPNLTQTSFALLLTGPPGTGKTHLARALAGQCAEHGVAFLNLSASSMTSKWRGDSEKLVSIAFQVNTSHHIYTGWSIWLRKTES